MVSKIIEVVGFSQNSWEEALKDAVEGSPDLPVFKTKNKISRVRVKELDVKVEENKVTGFLCRAEIYLD